ncbi:related to HOS4 - subunit of the Set3 complex [Melanopsichium pennsylvanicum]|uniref:Related to HOS4 - subunit of the Set3 complex n=2 Tax=Melanopsichium pennsylvanicum TaxID=63383 RepID=A0AAJ4XN86_9BASI|nr:fog: ankyrin repeat [Melanopsichium pennsylvanicum 4]SNX85263.1 related to HOS4 - subunit of the Set3 complex [Melanopsichium pennsylvanicum]
MMPPVLQSATSNPLSRSAKQSYLAGPAWISNLSHREYPNMPAIPGLSALSRTTLSQRFRRAIQQGDLASAQRIAARAFELQSLPCPAAHHGIEYLNQPNAGPLKASLRAADAQRPSSAHPFDMRNVESVPERVGLTKHHHHRKYTLAIHDESLTDTYSPTSSTDPSLVIAIKSNADVELVRWLIEMGHEQKGPSVDAGGSTVLHLATLYDRSDIIYAYSTYTNSHVAATLSDLIDAETLHDRRTPLHLACIRGYDDVARQLLDLGADVDLQDRAGNTALHFASAWGHTSLVQLLIERGCSLAVKNLEGSTPSDYAYSNSVKEALETMGRVRYESRKKFRRAPVATVMPAAVRPSVSTGAACTQFDESSTYEKSRSRPFPSFLSRNGSNGASRSHNTTPIRTTFAEANTDPTTELIDDWDPEKTFAQPGQDLFPGNRGAFSSPPVQRVASPANFFTPGRPSVDLYSEVLTHSPRAVTGFVSASQPRNASRETAISPPRPRHVAQSPPPTTLLRSPDEPLAQWQAVRKSLFPSASDSDAEMRRQLSPNLGSARRTPSPGVGSSSADKLRMQDAVAMSLFRSTTPQPGVPGRIDSPPIAQHRSESPFLAESRGMSGKVNLPPSGGENKATRNVSGAESARTSIGGEGPPLLVPIAALPRPNQDEQEVVNGDEEDRTAHNHPQTDTSGSRRDSSPSTPRPDNREVFG